MDQLVSKSSIGKPVTISRNRQLTMLLCSAGRRVGLLQTFRRAAGALGADLRILACDAQPEWSAACRLADEAIGVPLAEDPAYVDATAEICRTHGVGLVVPTIDPELWPLAQARARLSAIGSTVAVSEPAVIDICRDKLRTAQFLASHGVPVPRTEPLTPDLRTRWRGPGVLKPRHGSAGRAITYIEDGEALPTEATEPMIVQERLEGEEWTINLYFDGRGRVRSIVPHRRVQVRAGEVEKGVTGRSAALMGIAERLAACLPGARGALCFQAIVDAAGVAKVFEINARFGGGYPLADHAGAHFAQWLIEERLGLPSTATNTWAEGVGMLRFDSAIFFAS